VVRQVPETENAGWAKLSDFELSQTRGFERRDGLSTEQPAIPAAIILPRPSLTPTTVVVFISPAAAVTVTCSLAPPPPPRAGELPCGRAGHARGQHERGWVEVRPRVQVGQGVGQGVPRAASLRGEGLHARYHAGQEEVERSRAAGGVYRPRFLTGRSEVEGVARGTAARARLCVGWWQW